MMVDSGASHHYTDDNLFQDLRSKLHHYEEIKSPRAKTTAGMHKLLGTASGTLNVQMTHDNRNSTMGKLLVTVVPGIGHDLVSA